MSSSSGQENDDAGNTDRSDRDREDEANSAEELIAKVGTRCKTLMRDNVPIQDVAGPQFSKEGVKEAMKGAKKVNKIAPNMILNNAILGQYHKVKANGYCQKFY